MNLSVSSLGSGQRREMMDEVFGAFGFEAMGAKGESCFLGREKLNFAIVGSLDESESAAAEECAVGAAVGGRPLSRRSVKTTGDMIPCETLQFL